MKKYLKKYLNDTNIKIILIGLMIIGMIFLGNHQRANSEFNISDMSIVNSIPKNQDKIFELTKTDSK